MRGLNNIPGAEAILSILGELVAFACGICDVPIPSGCFLFFARVRRVRSVGFDS
jgi:hypothetical protein